MEESTAWITVGPVNGLPTGGRRVVEAGGERIVIVSLGREVCAFSARCPHEGGPLDEGELWEGEIECPWHHYRYDVRSGENTYPRRVYPSDMPELKAALAPLRRFPVRAEGKDILVNVLL